MAKDFGIAREQTLQVARRKYIVKSCFNVQKTILDAFSPLFYQKWIWTMLIRGKCKFLFE